MFGDFVVKLARFIVELHTKSLRGIQALLSEAKWVHRSLPLLSTRPNSSQIGLKNGANASPQAFSNSSPSSLPLCSVKHTAHPAIRRKWWDPVDDQLEELSEHDAAYLGAVAYVSSQRRLDWVIGLLRISVAYTRGGPAHQCRSRQLLDPTLVQRVLVQTQPHPHLCTSPRHRLLTGPIALPLSKSSKSPFSST